MSMIAAVTGAGTGVGRSAALALLREGMTVVLAGRRLEPLEQTAALARDLPGRALAIVADVTDPQSVASLFTCIREEFGRLDVLFNNAGINIPAMSLEDVSWEQWQSVVNTNLSGVFLCTREAFRLMQQQQPQGGRIINNGSISAQVPRPGSAAYTATKHAVSGLTKSTALDGRPYNIACGQIDIGNASTEMTSRMHEGVPQADGSVAVEPTMDVDHVGRAVAYMATLPLDANVQTMTVLATKMPYIGRG